MKIRPPVVKLAALLLTGCSYATKNGSELNAASVGNSCAAAGDGVSYAVSCANPEREKVLKALLLMVEKKHNVQN